MSEAHFAAGRIRAPENAFRSVRPAHSPFVSTRAARHTIAEHSSPDHRGRGQLGEDRLGAEKRRGHCTRSTSRVETGMQESICSGQLRPYNASAAWPPRSARELVSSVPSNSWRQTHRGVSRRRGVEPLSKRCADVELSHPHSERANARFSGS